MNDRQLNAVRAAVNIAYTSLVIGIIVYSMRGEIGRAVEVQRRELIRRRMRIEMTIRQGRARREFLHAIGPRLVAESTAAVDEHMDDALDAFNRSEAGVES